MEVWEEAGLTREEYEEAMEEASRVFGWDQPPSEAEMCGMHIEHVANIVREHGNDLNLEQYIDILQAYDEMLTLQEIAPDDYKRQLDGGDFDFIEKTLKMDIPEMTFEEHRGYWELETRAVAMMEGIEWEDLVEKYHIQESKPSECEGGIDYSKLPTYQEKEAERRYLSFGHDSRVLNSIENGRSNPDFDFDEYDDDEDDTSYGKY